MIIEMDIRIRKEYSKLAQKKYKTKYDWVELVIHENCVRN